MAVGYGEAVIVPRFSRVLFVLVALIGAVVEVNLVLGGPALLRFTPAPLLAGVLAWAVFFNPRVRVGLHEIEVVNVFRTHVLHWSVVRAVETRFTLTLVTDAGRLQVFAAPAPSALGDVSAHRARRPGAAERGLSGPAGDVAAALALRQWETHRDEPVPAGAPARTVRLHRVIVALTALLAVLTAVGAALPLG